MTGREWIVFIIIVGSERLPIQFFFPSGRLWRVKWGAINNMLGSRHKATWSLTNCDMWSP